MAASGVKRPILVVDDEPEMLFSLKGLLRREYEVFTASSAAEGTEILRNNPVHLVMTDQRMPEVTGVEFLKSIKHNYHRAIRLIFTGYADITAVIEAINQGNVFRYVTKPWDPDQLLAALREAGQQYDLIAGREQLLADLRVYEERCATFGMGLQNGTFGSLLPAGQSEGEDLGRVGRELHARIDRALGAAANVSSVMLSGGAREDYICAARCL